MTSPESPHITEALILLSKAAADGDASATRDAIKELRTALQDTLPVEEEIRARWFLASALWDECGDKQFDKYFLNSPQFEPILKEVERAISLDREHRCGFFATDSIRAMLQRLDMCLCQIGKAIEGQKGIDAGIAFSDKKLAFFDYLESNPLIGLKLDLGVRYLQTNQHEKARRCFLSIADTPAVSRFDEGGWEAGVRERASGALKAATGETGVPAASEKKCFIATAVYGSEDCVEVQTLREFRDRCLVRGEFGRDLAAAYYKVSPFIADRLRTSPTLIKVARRFVLNGCVRVARFALRRLPI